VDEDICVAKRGIKKEQQNENQSLIRPRRNSSGVGRILNALRAKELI